MKLVMIDNYDSFTYNLVQYLGELGSTPTVLRNDEVTVEDVLALEPDGLLISPGPCTPAEAGISVALITAASGEFRSSASASDTRASGSRLAERSREPR